MKILYIDWQFYNKTDITDAFIELGHNVHIYTKTTKSPIHDSEFSQELEDYIKLNHIESIFTSNFYPIISEVCQNNNIKYICWGYDSPYVLLYSPSIKNSCNYVFWFDKAECQRLWALGVETVFYLPLASNPNRIDKITLNTSQLELFGSDVSLVASLYNESHNLLDRFFPHLDDYTKGYLEALINVQKNLFGGYILETSLTNPEVINALRNIIPYRLVNGSLVSDIYTYANYFLARKVANKQRIEFIKSISKEHQMKVYTPGDLSSIPTAISMGTVDYLTDMNRVFMASKINLNITLPSIQTGMPLRVMDIMGAGGFLLTNYQEDFFEYFEPDKDFVYYTSIDEAIDKIDYYLRHDKERTAIASQAAKTMRNGHTILDRVKLMLEVCGN